MRLRVLVPVLLIAASVPVAVGVANARVPRVPFSDTGLIIEVNGTDGDAGLQVSADGEPWDALHVIAPDGEKILSIRTKSDLNGYGLTELFSESNEPPFDEVPFDEFKARFPEGVYTFRGRTVDGARLFGEAVLTHDVPDAPVMTWPQDGAVVPTGSLVVQWEPVTTPAGIDIVGYQVVVVREDGSREIAADLPPEATSLTLPVEFLESGAEYKAEVLAIEVSGNQTLTEVGFETE